jgi:epoxyqueuosine reductase
MTTLNSEIKTKLINAGASLVGFADVTSLPVEITDSMTSAISIAVALDASIINEIADGPTARYYQEYKSVNESLTHISETAVEYLKDRGNGTTVIKPTVEGKYLDYETLMTPIPHKTAARLAGLGWIGKSALLITEEYGPAVRLATVLTDAELEAAKPLNASSCGDCVKCMECCPAKAILGRNWELGLEREAVYDAFKCCDTATILSKKAGISSVICGICINVCPWTQKYILRELTS